MMNDLDRRTLLSASALMSLMAATGACAEPGGSGARARSKVLVAYFSRSGNTRVIAGTLQRALNADLFEIQPARPYPEDYEQTVEQSAARAGSRIRAASSDKGVEFGSLRHACS